MPLLTRSELADLNVFMTIVKRRSFRHSAIELGLTTSALSHSMKNLEARLGVKLLNRTTRSIVPTMAGGELAADLEQGFERIGDALGKLDRYRTSPAGRLRINAARDAGRLLLGPILPLFLTSYSDVQLEITVDDRLIDIIAEGYDAGIRYGGTVPKDMIAVPLTAALRWVIVGAPGYLTRHGRPERPDDLLRHACVRVRMGDNSVYKWELGEGEQARRVDVPGPLCVNESDASIQAAIDAVGLAYCLESRVSEELRRGTLEIVLPRWSSMGPPFCMYYPSRRQIPLGLQRLIELIRASQSMDMRIATVAAPSSRRRRSSRKR